MSVKLILEVINSRIDRNGNSYWAFVVTDVASGKKVAGNLGGSARGNAIHIVRELGYNWDEIYSAENELPIREFDRLIKGWPYMTAGADLRAAFKAQGVKVGKKKRK